MSSAEDADLIIAAIDRAANKIAEALDQQTYAMLSRAAGLYVPMREVEVFGQRMYDRYYKKETE